MDENVIFSKPIAPQKPQSQGGPQGDLGGTQTGAIQPVASQPKPAAQTPQPVGPYQPVQSATPPPPQVPPQVVGSESPLPPPPSSLPFGRVLKILGIALALVVVLFLIVRFVFPFFSKKEKTEPVTLTYWGLFEEKRVMDTIITDFQRENPTITVNYVRKDVKQYRQSLVTQIENGTGPDIYRFHNSWVGMMRSFLSPLTTGVIDPQEFKANYYPVIQQDLTRNGALYGMPLQIDTLALFVNTDLFDAGGNTVPKTWDEFIRVAKDRLVKDEDGRIRTAGAALGTYDNITHASDIIGLLMAQNGTNFSEFSKTTSNASQALEFYTAFAKNEGSVWDQTLDPSLVAFSKGNLAMFFGYSWDIFQIKALNPELKFSTHTVPNLPGRKMALASYWVEGVSSKSKHQPEAMLFMQYLAKKETLQKLYSETAKTRLFGQLYPRKDLAATLKNNQLIYPFMEQAEYASSSYFASDTYDNGINEQMNAYLGNAVRSQFDNTSTDTALETLAQGVNQVLTKYGR